LIDYIIRSQRHSTIRFSIDCRIAFL